jgi:hypothetical protein
MANNTAPAHTAASMSPMIGRFAHLVVGELAVEVKILDVRERWGRTDYLVTPVVGHGEQWKSADSVRVIEQK